MKAAFAVWEERIAPVFDVSRTLRVLDVEKGRIVKETRTTLGDDVPARKASFLAELGIDTLVCGAISRSFYEQIVVHRIKVIPFVTGESDRVVAAWMKGDLTARAFAMPGCAGRTRRGSNVQRRASMEGYVMNGRGRGGSGRGSGWAWGAAGRCGGRGRVMGTVMAEGECVCPACGAREPHEPGSPCVRRKCPKCGTAMKRA